MQPVQKENIVQTPPKVLSLPEQWVSKIKGLFVKNDSSDLSQELSDSKKILKGSDHQLAKKSDLSFIPSSSQAVSEKNPVAAFFHSLFDNKENEEKALQLTVQMIEQTTQLKQINKERASLFEEIQQFITADSDLTVLFQAGQKEKQEILLSLPIQDHSTPVSHQAVEEWRKEMLQDHYWTSMKTRFVDFLEKNPDFQKALINKCQERPVMEGSRMVAFLCELYPGRFN